MAWVKRVMAVVLSTKPARAFFLYQESQGPKLADGVTYRVLFSAFAGVFLGFAIAGVWLAGNPDAMDALVAAVDSIVPGLVGPDGLIDQSELVQPLGLGLAGIAASIGLAGTAIGAIGSLRAAMRRIGDRRDDPTFFLWLILRDLGLAIGFGLALVLAAALTVLSTAALSVVFDWLGIGTKSDLYDGTVRGISILLTFAIDTAVIAVMFRALSGLRPNARSLWSGAIIGGIGLTVLQVLSGLFVGGADKNPLLASFASIIALLLWLNFSAQVILLATAYIVVGIDEEKDRVSARYGASTLALRNLRRSERRAADAVAQLEDAREAVDKERKASS